MVQRVLSASGATSDASELVEGCLEVLGPMDVSDETRDLLLEIASSGMQNGEPQTNGGAKVSQRLILDLFRFIVASREYQLC